MIQAKTDPELDKRKGKPHDRKKPTLRSCLLLAVNLPVAALGSAFLAYDYTQELSQRLDSKRIALEEEAKSIFPAVVRIQQDGARQVQEFIDDVCARMQDVESPGHHIAVELAGRTIQAEAHFRASPEIMRAMRDARSSGRGLSVNPELIVGSYGEEGATIYVSEWLRNVRRAVRGGVLRRSAGVAVVAIVATAIVNVVLIRVVSRPLERLVETVHQIGRGALGEQTASFRTRELGYLADEVNAMSRSLAAADKARRLQMAQAREIQRNLLPNGVEPDEFVLAHLFMPADDVGGDFFDILRLNDTSWLVCLADVSGHGIPAAMNAAMLKTLVTQASRSHASPSQLLREVNQQFTAMSLQGDFATIFVLDIDTAAGCLRYASAGHDPGWLLAGRGILEQLPSTGLLVGIDCDATWEERTLSFRSRDRVLLVTDGVCETSDPSGLLYGRERIGELLESHSDATAAQLIDALNQSLRRHRGAAKQTDDVTALLIEKRPAADQ